MGHRIHIYVTKVFVSRVQTDNSANEFLDAGYPWLIQLSQSIELSDFIVKTIPNFQDWKVSALLMEIGTSHRDALFDVQKINWRPGFQIGEPLSLVWNVASTSVDLLPVFILKVGKVILGAVVFVLTGLLGISIFYLRLLTTYPVNTHTRF